MVLHFKGNTPIGVNNPNNDCLGGLLEINFHAAPIFDITACVVLIGYTTINS